MSRRQNKALERLLSEGWEVTILVEREIYWVHAHHHENKVRHNFHAPTLGDAMRGLLHEAIPNASQRGKTN